MLCDISLSHIRSLMSQSSRCGKSEIYVHQFGENPKLGTFQKVVPRIRRPDCRKPSKGTSLTENELEYVDKHPSDLWRQPSR